jgi:hypothetical protein
MIKDYITMASNIIPDTLNEEIIEQTNNLLNSMSEESKNYIWLGVDSWKPRSFVYGRILLDLRYLYTENFEVLDKERKLYLVSSDFPEFKSWGPALKNILEII